MYSELTSLDLDLGRSDLFDQSEHYNSKHGRSPRRFYLLPPLRSYHCIAFYALYTTHWQVYSPTRRLHSGQANAQDGALE